jgi:hypothetical protein
VAACPASVRARPKASRDLVGASASRARRRWAAQGEPGKWSSDRRPFSVRDLGLGLGFRGVCSGSLSGIFSGVLFSLMFQY